MNPLHYRRATLPPNARVAWRGLALQGPRMLARRAGLTAGGRGDAHLQQDPPAAPHAAGSACAARPGAGGAHPARAHREHGLPRHRPAGARPAQRPAARLPGCAARHERRRRPRRRRRGERRVDLQRPVRGGAARRRPRQPRVEDHRRRDGDVGWARLPRAQLVERGDILHRRCGDSEALRISSAESVGVMATSAPGASVRQCAPTRARPVPA